MIFTLITNQLNCLLTSADTCSTCILGFQIGLDDVLQRILRDVIRVRRPEYKVMEDMQRIGVPQHYFEVNDFYPRFWTSTEELTMRSLLRYDMRRDCNIS
ncbi:hypothetical protein M8C21_010001, partial [Ambrosia artemisiifolia]